MFPSDHIRALNWLIREYEEDSDELHRMIDLWDNHDDPMSDPGLQFEQSEKVEQKYKKVIKYLERMKVDFEK